MSSVISNTSPLIALSAIGDLGLLPQIFTSVLVPVAVEQEIAAGVRPWHVKVALDEALGAGWMTLAAASTGPRVRALRERLGAGEGEAIALAKERHLPVLIDDLKGRKAAADLDLVVIGTLGVLARSKRKGIIPQVRPRIQLLREAGIYLPDTLVERLLHELNEI